jgi:hypothetical protein
MSIERSRRQKLVLGAAALLAGVPLFLVACGQNAHVTRPDLLSSNSVEPGMIVTQEEETSESQIQQQQSRTACPTRVEKRFLLRAMGGDEIRSTELPYQLGSLELRTLGTEVYSSSRSQGCGGNRSHAQVVFAADLIGLPPRHMVKSLKRVSLEMKLIRPTTVFDGTEMMCLIDERVCSGGNGSSCGLNREFWSSFANEEVRYMNKHFVDQLRNEHIWKRREAGQGKLTSDFQIDFRRFLSGSKYSDLESFLYMNSVKNEGLVDRTLRIAMVDDLMACAGEIVVDMIIDPCGGSL